MYVVKIKAEAFGETIEFYIGEEDPIRTYHGMFNGGVKIAFKKSGAKRFSKSDAEKQIEIHGGSLEEISKNGE